MSALRTLLSQATRCTSLKPHFTMPIVHVHRNYATGQLNRQDIGSRIIQLIRDFDKVTSDKVTEESHFTKDLGLDSLDTVEVVMAIEEEFSIEIPDKEADSILTVKQAVDYIASRQDAV